MPLVWFALAWLAGIAAGSNLPLQGWQWGLLAATSSILAALFRRVRRDRWTFALCAALSLGACRFHLSEPRIHPGHIAFYNDLRQQLTITGVVVEDPKVFDGYVELTLAAERVRSTPLALARPVEGRALVRASLDHHWAYGDWVRAEGYLETPEHGEDFSYRDYLARRRIFSMMPVAHVRLLGRGNGNPLLRAIYGMRQRLLGTLYNLFPDPEASLLAGILLGIETGITPEVRDDFDRTGTTHIIAISGFNLTLIAGLFIHLFRRWLGNLRGLLPAAFGVVLYALLVGADAAVMRAAIMTLLVLSARFLGRQSHGLNSLAAAALIMTALNPRMLWDLGFQLSFAATLGLVLYAKPLQKGSIAALSHFVDQVTAERLSNPLSEFLLFTVAAQITTLPILAAATGRLSLISLVANPIILPLQPGLMILGGLAALSGGLWLPLGRPLALLAWPFPALTIRAVRILAQVPGSTLPLGASGFTSITLYYAILFGATAWAFMPEEKRPRLGAMPILLPSPARWALPTLAVAAGLVWRAWSGAPDGRLHLTILDVGGGDAVLIQTPQGEAVLINGGPSRRALSEALGSRLPLERRRLAWVVLASADKSQIAGLEAVQGRMAVDHVLVAAPLASKTSERMIQGWREQGTPIDQGRIGQRLDLGEGQWLEVMVIGDQGATFLLQAGRGRLLLPVGADPDTLPLLRKHSEMHALTALLLPACGHPALNPPGWIDWSNPGLLLLSCSGGTGETGLSTDGESALQRRTILQTDLHGDIEIVTDGLRLWVQTSRGNAGK